MEMIWKQSAARMPRRLSMTWAWVLSCFLVFHVPHGVLAQSGITPEELKAQWVLEFADRTAWPKEEGSGASQPLVLALVGGFARSHSLFKLDGLRMRNGRVISVRVFADMKDRQAIAKCQLVYLHRSLRSRYAKLFFKDMVGTQTMIFCDRIQFYELGPVVCFDLPRKTKLSLKVDLEAIRRQKLRVDAELESKLKQVGGM